MTASLERAIESEAGSINDSETFQLEEWARFFVEAGLTDSQAADMGAAILRAEERASGRLN